MVEERAVSPADSDTYIYVEAELARGVLTVRVRQHIFHLLM